jgi:hypothetical protein
VQHNGLNAFERIGEEGCEVLEHRRASMVVMRIVRPKFVRRVSESKAAQTEAAAQTSAPKASDRFRLRMRYAALFKPSTGASSPRVLSAAMPEQNQACSPIPSTGDARTLCIGSRVSIRETASLAWSTLCGWHEPLANYCKLLVEAMKRDALTQPVLCTAAPQRHCTFPAVSHPASPDAPALALGYMAWTALAMSTRWAARPSRTVEVGSVTPRCAPTQCS